MTIEEFVKVFAGEFDETPESQFTPTTVYKDLDEWGSLTALGIISMVDEQLEKRITGADLRANKTILDLYNFINSK